MRRPALYEDLGGVPVAAVAAALGMTAGRSGSWGPCPCCGAERRGRDDARGPVGAHGIGWRCHRCRASGDAAALVLAVATGATKAGADGWATARELAERCGLARPADVGADGARRPSGGVGQPLGARVAPVALPDAVARSLPPADAVAALWATCGPVSRCADAVAWLHRRGLDPVAVEALELARVCPATAWRGWSSTTWARRDGRSWGAGWRLVLPCYGDEGQLVTLRARWVLDEAAPGGSKEIAPAGHAAGPALFADRGGRELLEGTGGAAVLVVVEGGPAWLRYAIEAAGRPSGAVAVVGLWAGAWSAALADRLAAARRWTVATDADEAGDRYAAAVLRDAELRGVKVERWLGGEAGQGPDDVGATLDDLAGAVNNATRGGR